MLQQIFISFQNHTNSQGYRKPCVSEHSAQEVKDKKPVRTKHPGTGDPLLWANSRLDMLCLDTIDRCYSTHPQYQPGDYLPIMKFIESCVEEKELFAINRINVARSSARERRAIPGERPLLRMYIEGGG